MTTGDEDRKHKENGAEAPLGERLSEGEEAIEREAKAKSPVVWWLIGLLALALLLLILLPTYLMG